MSKHRFKSVIVSKNLNRSRVAGMLIRRYGHFISSDFPISVILSKISKSQDPHVNCIEPECKVAGFAHPRGFRRPRIRRQLFEWIWVTSIPFELPIRRATNLQRAQRDHSPFKNGASPIVIRKVDPIMRGAMNPPRRRNPAPLSDESERNLSFGTKWNGISELSLSEICVGFLGSPWFMSALSLDIVEIIWLLFIWYLQSDDIRWKSDNKHIQRMSGSGPTPPASLESRIICYCNCLRFVDWLH